MEEEICTVCGGEGTIESEFFVRASVDNDYGFIDTKVEECEAVMKPLSLKCLKVYLKKI